MSRTDHRTTACSRPDPAWCQPHADGRTTAPVDENTVSLGGFVLSRAQVHRSPLVSPSPRERWWRKAPPVYPYLSCASPAKFVPNTIGGEVARAHQACQFDGVTTVGFDAIPRLFGDQGGRYDPADMAFFGQIAVEPVAT